MKKFGLAVALAAACSTAWADWVEILKTQNATFFVHSSSMERSGDTVKMWYMANFKTVQADSNTKSFLSTKDHSEYDCKEARARTIFYNNYSEPMGDGKITFTLKDPLKWRPVERGSIAEVLLKIACGKK